MNRHKRILTFSALISIIMQMAVAERKTLINDGWKFKLMDNSVSLDVRNFEAPELNDKDWQTLRLPHDWSIEFKFDKNAESGNDGAYLPTGTGWYRRNLKIDKESLENKLQLYFEGAYMKTSVYVNGDLVGTNPYGYSSFFVDITPFVKEGDNSIAVKVDNSMQKNCRWYSGSGIYRNVWLTETDKTHIGNWGVQIFTPALDTTIIKVNVQNESDEARNIVVSTYIDGKTADTECFLQPNESKTVEQTLNIHDAKAWSTDSPNLYTADVMLIENGRKIDEVSERFGFKTVNWSSTEGLKINGVPTLLYGGCVHHDNGILGAAAYNAAERYRVKKLKDAGFNAIRTSHNIPSEEFLNACDEVGLLVIDEAFDGWRDAKNSHDYHELFDKNWQKDLGVMLRRDMNHPSIFCWSVGNEVIERDKIEVVTTARDLVALCHELDPYRPVTSALANWGREWRTYDPLAEAFDITGYNYVIHEAEIDHQRDPGRVIMQTESYPNDVWSNYRKSKDNPYIIGDFVWTAMDYIGESGIGRWFYDGDVPGEHYERPLFPWHASYCGDIDLTGYRKPISHYRSMLWNDDGEQLYMAVREPDGYYGKVMTTLWGTWPTFESWNWPGNEGKDICVEIYSRYPEVRLYLDDTLVGETATEEMKSQFTLPYKEGILRAEGLRDGKVMGTKILKSAGAPTAIRLSADRTNLKSDEDDLSFIMIEIVDADGNVVPIADNQLEVKVNGNFRLQALGNADIKDEDIYTDDSHKAWKGRALAVVRNPAKKGSSTVTVTSPGLKSATLKLSAK